MKQYAKKQIWLRMALFVGAASLLPITIARAEPDRATTIEIGGRNIGDELPDPLFNLSGIETFLHDPRGAMYYLRLNQEI